MTFIRFNPFTSCLPTNPKNILLIENILREYRYFLKERLSPQVYVLPEKGKFNELENFLAIGNTVPELLVESSKVMNPEFPKTHYSAIDIQCSVKRYDPGEILKGKYSKVEFFYPEDPELYIYRNALLTSLWYNRKPNVTEIRIVMEKGTFHDSYLLEKQTE